MLTFYYLYYFTLQFNWNDIRCLYLIALTASELRSWLFHYSLPCLRGVLPEKYLHHYLLLVNAVWLLNQESITKKDLACSNFCFLKFVLYFDGLYGKLNLIMNYLGYYMCLWWPLSVPRSHFVFYLIMMLNTGHTYMYYNLGFQHLTWKRKNFNIKGWWIWILQNVCGILTVLKNCF